MGLSTPKNRSRLRVSKAAKLMFLHENHGSKSNDSDAMTDPCKDKQSDLCVLVDSCDLDCTRDSRDELNK